MILTTTVTISPPSVELMGSGMPAGVTRLVVSRDAGGDSWPVRGAQESLVGTGFQLFDREIPVGVSVTYRVIAYSSTGTVLDSASSVLSLPDIDRSAMWLSDPLDETSAMLVSARIGTDEVRSASREKRLATPLGSRLPVVSAGPLIQMQDWPLVVTMRDAASVAAMRDLLTNCLVLCIRPAGFLQLPPVMYGVVDWDEQPWHEQQQRTSRFVASLTPARPTTLPVTVYAWTYANTVSLGGTYADALVQWPTYADWRRGMG